MWRLETTASARFALETTEETTEKSINTQAYHPASTVLLDVFYYTSLKQNASTC